MLKHNQQKKLYGWVHPCTCFRFNTIQHELDREMLERLRLQKALKAAEISHQETMQELESMYQKRMVQDAESKFEAKKKLQVSALETPRNVAPEAGNRSKQVGGLEHIHQKGWA